MKIFVTVGTTSFDPLVEAIDKGPHAGNALIQIADGSYEPTTASWFRFRPGIQEEINSADVVVCHAGAGSVFGMLQDGIVPLVVPNTVRRDQHQLELTRWVQRNKYAVVAMSTDKVNEALDGYSVARQSCVEFSEQRFFYQDTLNQIARKQLGLSV